MEAVFHAASLKLRRMARGLAAVLALLPPAIYFVDSSLDSRATLKRDTLITADILSDRIDWSKPFPPVDLQQHIDRLPFPDYFLQIMDMDDKHAIFQSANLRPRSPGLQSSVTLTDPAGRPQAILNTHTSLRPQLLQAGVVFIASGSVAVFLFWLFRSLPMRLIEQFERERLEIRALLELAEQEKLKALEQLANHNNELNHMASHDQLTGLYNRQHFEQLLLKHIDRARKTGSSFSVVLFDLDQFKDINDTLGHHSGDLVLREIAQRLRCRFKEGFTLARFGGDEFGVIVENNARVDELRTLANEMHELIERPFTLQGYTLDTTASMGLVIYPDHGDHPDMLLQHADVAMYESKNRKQHLVIYHPENDLNSLSHLTLRGELRTAIDTGGLQVFYQPKVSFTTQQISGVEALVRWSHPERGFVSPSHFIPVAEQTGLIHPLTSFVFDRSLNQAARWQGLSLPINLAVNLSMRSLHDRQLPEKIQHLLETWKVPAPLLTIEITESAIMAEPERALAIISDIASMGVHISVDDYGTGFSSLSYIKKLPIQEIKIDRSFVTDMAENENDSIIVRATIDMAHDLGLKVTAEGVESAAAMDMLAEYGCDHVQGFYVAKPLNEQDLAQWLNSSRFGLTDRQANG